MKTLNLAFLLTLSLFILSCSKDDDPKFEPLSLKQTTWEGTEIITDGDKIIKVKDVLMQFFAIDSGQYILKEKGYSTGVYDFKYSLEGKLMNIKDGPLCGIWTLLETSDKKIVMEEFGSYKVTITLNRKY